MSVFELEFVSLCVNKKEIVYVCEIESVRMHVCASYVSACRCVLGCVCVCVCVGGGGLRAYAFKLVEVYECVCTRVFTFFGTSTRCS